jgi:hypothetical protein
MNPDCFHCSRKNYSKIHALIILPLLNISTIHISAERRMLSMGSPKSRPEAGT